MSTHIRVLRMSGSIQYCSPHLMSPLLVLPVDVLILREVQKFLIPQDILSECGYANVFSSQRGTSFWSGTKSSSTDRIENAAPELEPNLSENTISRRKRTEIDPVIPIDRSQPRILSNHHRTFANFSLKTLGIKY